MGFALFLISEGNLFSLCSEIYRPLIKGTLCGTINISTSKWLTSPQYIYILDKTDFKLSWVFLLPVTVA